MGTRWERIASPYGLLCPVVSPLKMAVCRHFRVRAGFPVARATAYGTEGHRFESCRARSQTALQSETRARSRRRGIARWERVGTRLLGSQRRLRLGDRTRRARGVVPRFEPGALSLSQSPSPESCSTSAEWTLLSESRRPDRPGDCATAFGRSDHAHPGRPAWPLLVKSSRGGSVSGHALAARPEEALATGRSRRSHPSKTRTGLPWPEAAK